MARFATGQIDLLSFLLGLITGFVFFLIISGVKRYYPKITGLFKLWIISIKNRAFAGIEQHFKNQMVSRCQQNHIAKNLFPLEKIVVQTRVLVPSSIFTENERSNLASMPEQIFQYSPLCAELFSEIPGQGVNLQDILRNGACFILTGNPGDGKTCCLSNLTIQIAKNYLNDEYFNNKIPIYLHCLDFSNNMAQQDAGEILQQIFFKLAKPYPKNRARAFLENLLQENRAILMIDGLDEQPYEEAFRISSIIEQIHERYPHLQILTTGSIDFAGPLVGRGFIPIRISPWGIENRRRLLQNWLNNFKTKIPKSKDIVNNLQLKIIEHWLDQENHYFTPLEWTLKIWAILTNDSASISYPQYFFGYFYRLLQNSYPIKALQVLAKRMLDSRKSCLSYEEVGKCLSNYKKVSDKLAADEDYLNTHFLLKQSKNKKIKNRDLMIDHLLHEGFFIETEDGNIRFCNPFFLGFLAAGMPPSRLLPQSTKWCSFDIYIQQCAQTIPEEDILDYLNVNSDDPEQAYKYVKVGHWISKSNPIWKTKVLKIIAGNLFVSNQPIYIRYFYLLALLISSDPGVTALLTQMAKSNNDENRFLAFLGFSHLRDFKYEKELTNGIKDKDSLVKIASTYALNSLRNQTAEKNIEEVLIGGDESQQQVAAECIIQWGQEGKSILLKNANHPNVLVRRAAYLALSQLHDDEILELMQKASVEDSQWVIRNIAGHYLENQSETQRLILSKIPAYWDSPPLISFSARNGIGVLKGTHPIILLQPILTDGSLEEKLTILEYIGLQPTNDAKTVILEELPEMNDYRVIEKALNVLWRIMLLGVEESKSSLR